jgi:hypothetical protein
MEKLYAQLSLVERVLLQTQLVLRWSPTAMPRGQLRARILTLLRRAHQHRRKRSAGKDRGKVHPQHDVDRRPAH